MSDEQETQQDQEKQVFSLDFNYLYGKTKKFRGAL